MSFRFSTFQAMGLLPLYALDFVYFKNIHWVEGIVKVAEGKLSMHKVLVSTPSVTKDKKIKS
jgi:hypothetical protein